MIILIIKFLKVTTIFYLVLEFCTSSHARNSIYLAISSFFIIFRHCTYVYFFIVEIKDTLDHKIFGINKIPN